MKPKSFYPVVFGLVQSMIGGQSVGWLVFLCISLLDKVSEDMIP